MEKRSLEGRGRVVGGAGSEGQSRWHWHGSLASVRGYDRWRERRCAGPGAPSMPWLLCSVCRHISSMADLQRRVLEKRDVAVQVDMSHNENKILGLSRLEKRLVLWREIGPAD